MKRLISILLSLALAVSFSMTQGPAFAEETIDLDDVPTFQSYNDPAFLQYVEDMTLASFESTVGSDDYSIVAVQAIYISQEYIDELAYNLQSNIYFGYTLDEINAQYSGKKYVFTLGDDNKTVVKEFEPYDHSADVNSLIKNVAIGSGVILVCVTVSVATSGTSTPMVVQMIHAIAVNASKQAVKKAATGSIIGAVSAAMVAYQQHGAIQEIWDAAAEGAAEGFKWGAISGAVKGGTKGAIQFKTTHRTPQQSEIHVAELYKGNSQQSFMDGKKVQYGAEGSTRPDVTVTKPDGTLEAIEVKNYDLLSGPSICELVNNLVKQVGDRVKHLPAGSTQRIVLDVSGRGYTQ